MRLSQAQLAALRKQLEAIAEHSPDPRIKEMARDVLGGKTDLRAAMLGPNYRDALNESMRAFSTWYRNLSDEQRAEQERRAEEHMEDLRKQAAEKQAGVRRPRPEPDEDWEMPASFMEKKRRRR